MGGKPRAKRGTLSKPMRPYLVLFEHFAIGVVSGIVHGTDPKNAEREAPLVLDLDARADGWEFKSCSLLERCHGCGGYRMASSPDGMGAVDSRQN